MKTTSAGPIRLFVLGDARIETPVRQIEPTATMVFAAALYLILQGNNSVTRRELELILWPGIAAVSASHRLRQTIHRLRRSGIAVDSIGKTRIKLGHSVIISDFVDFIENRAPSEQAQRDNLVLLPGYEPRFSPRYLDWLDDRKRDIGSQIATVLVEAIAKHRSAAQWAQVESVATTLSQVEPFNEQVTIALAESFAMRGSKLQAVRILDAYLDEVGHHNGDLGRQAALMKRRIAGNAVPQTDPESNDAPFIGRTGVLSELGSMLSTTRAGSGQTCLVLGEAGIGKSRVLAEFSRFAALKGVSVQRVHCRPSHKSRPLSLFVELAPALRGLRGAIGCSPDTLAYIDRLTQHRPLNETTHETDSGSEWVYGRVQRALFDIVDAVSEETPLVIHIEDVHWLDATSSQVLGDMIAWARSRAVLFALTGREPPEAWEDNFPDWIRTIVLTPLDSKDANELVLSMARKRGRVINSDDGAWCVRVGEGNPYFLQELAAHWVESGGAHEVPASLSALLDRRVDRLDRDSLQLLQTCALLENNSTLHRLELVLQYEAHRLLTSITTLGEAGMIVLEQDDRDGAARGRIASKHELLSNVALSRLSDPAKAFLHRRAGLVLEQEVDSLFSTSVLWDCAKHWHLAGDSQRGLSLALSCAHHLMKVGLPQAAADAYSKCLPLCTTDQQRSEVLEGETLASYRVSDWQRVRDLAAVVRTLKSRIRPNESTHDELELMDLRAEWQSLQWEEITRKATACLNASEATARHRVEAGIMAMMLLGFQGETHAMTATYDQVELLCSESDVAFSLRLESQMVFHTGFGDLAEGIRAAQALLLEQRTRGNVADLFRAHCNAAVTFRVAGLFDDAEQSLLQALQLAESHRLELSMVRALPMLANMALERGLIAEATSWFNRLTALNLHPSNRFGQLEIGAIGVRLALLVGDANEARRRIMLTRKEAQTDPIFHRRTYNCALQVATDLARDGATTADMLKSLTDAFDHSKKGLHQAFSACVLKVALASAGQSELAESLFNSYTAEHRREPWPVPEHLLASLTRVAKRLAS
ncbi:MAG: AAA family ATPase [Gemmatimonadaceae bacterium]|nr:AAA family ATPase [Gemmatimonadaceae bacterium]